jgi:O-Antigen ligase
MLAQARRLAWPGARTGRMGLRYGSAIEAVRWTTLAVVVVSTVAGGFQNLEFSASVVVALMAVLIVPSYAQLVSTSGAAEHSPRVTGLLLGGVMCAAGTMTLAGTICALALSLLIARRPGPITFVYPLLICLPLLVEAFADNSRIIDGLNSLALLLAAIYTWKSSARRSDLIQATATACATFLCVAIVLYLLGVRAAYASAYVRGSDTDFGFFDERWRFPLAVTWVAAPGLSVMLIALAAALLRRALSRDSGPRVALDFVEPTLMIVLACFVIAASNGRTFVVSALVAFILGAGLLGRRLGIFVTFASLVLLTAPLWWDSLVSSANVFTDILTTYVPVREGNVAGLLSLEGRQIIWNLSLQAFSQGTAAQQLTGWGPDGYVPSGAALAYSYLFSYDYATAYYPSHNSMLELLLSQGILGLLYVSVFLAVVAFMAFRAAWRSEEMWSGSLGVLCVVGLVGWTEVIALPSNMSPVAIAPIVAAGIVCIPSRSTRSAIDSKVELSAYERTAAGKH